METMTGLDIIAAYQEFSLARAYQQRLALFDSYFNVLPFAFPDFDEQLSFLRLQPAIDRMYQIHKEESQRSIVLRKVFTVEKTIYVFDVTPINSLPPSFNAFIIEKFISNDAQFRALSDCIQKGQPYMDVEMKRLLEESDTILEELQLCFQVKKKKHFRAQLVSVFLSGYHDAAKSTVKTFRYRKKIIELYLYAQGILYCRYRLKLQQFIAGHVPDILPAAQETLMEWTAQIQLLQKMGMLDLLKKRINETSKATAFESYMKTVCRIIGQSPLMADSVGDYLAQLEERECS